MRMKEWEGREKNVWERQTTKRKRRKKKMSERKNEIKGKGFDPIYSESVHC